MRMLDPEKDAKNIETQLGVRPHPSSASLLGSSQNQGPILISLDTGCCNIHYNQKGPVILRTTPIAGCSN